MSKFLKFALPLAAAMMMLAPSEGSADLLGKTFRTSVKLSDDDLALIRNAVREGLAGKPNGTTLSWSNATSGNSGTVTLLDSFPSQGRDCRRVKYLLNPGPKQIASAKPSTYVMTNCRLADGNWKIDNEAKRDKAP
jgi:surface antigen